jgi:hypothetical protein
MKGRPILNKVLSEIGNVDARRGADVFLEILLSRGPIYLCPEAGRGKQILLQSGDETPGGT